jgi:dTDP-4-dehydrorhamnose reductase
MKKIFIAGASSYIGKNLIFFLSGKDLELSASYYKNNIFKKNKKIYSFQLDLTKNKSIKKIIKIDPDIIINLAFLKKNKKTSNIKKDFNENIIINRNLINYCKIYKKKLIFTSSDKVYSGKTKRPSENKDVKPGNIYGITKLKCENEIKKNLKNYLILRFATVYSEEKVYDKNFINKKIYSIKNKKKVYLATNVYRLFISSEYLCKIMYKLIIKKAIGTFNIGSKASSYYNLVLSICKKNKISAKKYLYKSIIRAHPEFLIPKTNKLFSFLRNVK